MRAIYSKIIINLSMRTKILPAELMEGSDIPGLVFSAIPFFPEMKKYDSLIHCQSATSFISILYNGMYRHCSMSGKLLGNNYYTVQLSNTQNSGTAT